MLVVPRGYMIAVDLSPRARYREVRALGFLRCSMYEEND